MVEVISFLTSSLTITLLVVYVFALWAALVLWTWFDVSDRTENALYRLGAVLIVATGIVLGFAIYLLLRPGSTKDEIQMRRVEEAILSSQAHLYTCPECFSVIKEEYLYCTNCAVKLVEACGNCSSNINITWNVCPYCGTKQPRETVEKPKEQPQVAPGLASQKRVRTAALFSSIFSYLNKVRNERAGSRPTKTAAKKTKKSTRSSRKRKS